MSTVIDARDMTVVHELTMSPLDMGWIARGLLAAAARDEVSGIRYHAHVVADGETAEFTATDGYRLHQMHVTLREAVDTVDVVIPRTVLQWANKNARFFRPKKDALIEPVAILHLELPAIPDEKTPGRGWAAVIFREWDDADAPSARFDAPLVPETYPPTDRLIRIARIATPGDPSPIRLDHLSDTQELQTPYTTTPTIQYTTAATGRPGPALLDFWEGAVLRATALIQPTKVEDDE